MPTEQQLRDEINHLAVINEKQSNLLERMMEHDKKREEHIASLNQLVMRTGQLLDIRERTVRALEAQVHDMEDKQKKKIICIGPIILSKR